MKIKQTPTTEINLRKVQKKNDERGTNREEEESHHGIDKIP